MYITETLIVLQVGDQVIHARMSENMTTALVFRAGYLGSPHLTVKGWSLPEEWSSVHVGRPKESDCSSGSGNRPNAHIGKEWAALGSLPACPFNKPKSVSHSHREISKGDGSVACQCLCQTVLLAGV